MPSVKGQKFGFISRLNQMPYIAITNLSVYNIKCKVKHYIQGITDLANRHIWLTCGFWNLR